MDIVFLLCCILVTNCSKSQAQSSDSLPQMPGWPKSLSGECATGVVLTDINQDSFLEILVGTWEPDGGEFYVWDYLGNFLPGWPKTLPNGILSKPAVADLDPAYSGLEIIIADFGGAKIHAWHSDGTNVPGWPYYLAMTGHSCSPVITDIDHDGDLEVIYSSQNGVHVINHDGTPFPGWPIWTSSAGHTPSVADVDQDAIVDICIQINGGIYLYDSNGNVKEGWPIINEDWASSYVQPVLADLDSDGDLEIIVAYSIQLEHQNYVAIYHHDGSSFLNWPKPFPGPQTFTTPVVGDIDNDGDLEICGGGHVPSPDLGFMFRHHTGDTVQGWPQVVSSLECTPIILDLDLDSNGKREIIINSNSNLIHQFLAFHDDGMMVSGWPQTTGCSFPNAAAVGDVDRDGDLEIAIVAGDGSHGFPIYVYLFTLEGVEYHPYMAEWGSWFHDNWNTGWFHPRAPQNLQATSTPNWVRLTWDANTEPDIAGYRVYRSSSSGGPYTKLNDTLLTQTTYYDIPPDSNTYYYCVTARILAETESRLSEEVWGYLGLAEQNISIIPVNTINPTIFNRNISFYGSVGEVITAEVFDTKGAVMDHFSGVGVAQWSPGNNIPVGIYFIKIMADDQSTIHKVIKIR